jgi:hypothetical protein
MPVRRLTTNKLSGYGSFGETVIGGASSTTFTLTDELSFIRPLLPTTNQNNEAVGAICLSINFRWKVSILQADLSRLQTYNNITGKRRYGVCIAETVNYVCDETFVSFDDQISDVFTNAYMLVGNEGEEDIPCDEPPSQTQIPIVENALWFAKSFPAAGNINVGSPNPFFSKIADKVIFYPELPVKIYIFGGSYVYNVIGLFTLNEYENIFGRPPVINI